VGKLEVFTAAIDAGQAWLAVVAVVNTVVSLYPYLRVIAPAVLQEPGGPDAPRRAVATGAPLGLALAVSTVATVGFGIAAEPLLMLAERSVMLAP
jgi:NADH-quinone oxidoreductase subunit N